jgi:hypothetical protein
VIWSLLAQLGRLLTEWAERHTREAPRPIASMVAERWTTPTLQKVEPSAVAVLLHRHASLTRRFW